MPEKGPSVFLDYDQAELDAAYDQAAHAPNREQLIKRRISDSELARLCIGGPARVTYGPAEIEQLTYTATALDVPWHRSSSSSVTTIGRATAASRRTLWRVASASGWVRDEQVERIPRPGSRRRKRLGGIGEIFTVRAVHRC
jgi:hypothetical protein